MFSAPLQRFSVNSLAARDFPAHAQLCTRMSYLCLKLPSHWESHLGFWILNSECHWAGQRLVLKIPASGETSISFAWFDPLFFFHYPETKKNLLQVVSFWSILKHSEQCDDCIERLMTVCRISLAIKLSDLKYYIQEWFLFTLGLLFALLNVFF